ncbi:MAG: prolipoprotein diacylglyceryl transferase [Nitrospira bacterium SG8_35_4]|nr:MAG: prolipoprotein diacylglyceryl transferase [Nitrospira bacterium SG8_35_4]
MDQIITAWQHIPEHLTPYIFRIGEFEIRYYGLMYIVAFSVVYFLSVYRLNHEDFDYAKNDIEDYFVWAILGLMLGARFGYVLFYNFTYYLDHPLEIILPFSFQGGIHFTGLSGMSYHGGLIGVLAGTALFCRKRKLSYLRFVDFLIPSIPLGYTFGRLGNFINGELYGRATTSPIGMYFPSDPSGLLRHPSQLYEAFFEGIFLFLILWLIRRKKAFDGMLLSLYIIGYGAVRFFIEFVREPDSHIGFIFGFLSLGQILCLCMILGGAVLFYFRRRAEMKS